MISLKEFLEKNILVESVDSDTARAIVNQSKHKSFGLTNFKISKNKLKVEHSGNMGNSIKDVKQNAKKFFGFDVFKKLKLLSEKGSPDYLYTATFKLEPFKKV